MSGNRWSARQRRASRSSALVITLAALVLVCGLVLLFFNQSNLARQLSFSSSGQYRADLVAHTALDTIIGDFRTEVAAGSTNYISNNFSIYIPSNNFTAVPAHVEDQGLPNVVAQSAANSNFWTGTAYNASYFNPIRSAPQNSTQNPDINGHTIKINLWNQAGLLGDPGDTSSGSPPAIPASYSTPPDWVIVTRQGAVSNALAAPVTSMGTLSDKTQSNDNFVVGRYAYVVYNEGGLLDVNVAGFPNTLSSNPDFTGKKGILPQVNLASIPGIDSNANADALVQWRNRATATSATTYTNSVFSATNGFLTVNNGDQTFVSRQDLIRYAQTHSSQMATSALQYLGTFTREVDAPSYTPPKRATVRLVLTLTPYFLAPTTSQTLFNPSLINQRVTSSFTRTSDATTAQPGEPLVKYRFPLSRLAWLGHNGPIGGTNKQIYDSFGLTWSTTLDNAAGGTMSGWVYNHGDPQRILKLADLVAGGDPGSPNGREPDFFELLQAGINIGSLGGSAGKTSVSDTTGIDSYGYYHILTIGANLIDQFDSDSFPTVISFNPTFLSASPVAGFVLCGKENLPYINRLYYRPFRRNQDADGYTRPYLGFWMQPELWNPCAQATTLDPNGPTQFRIFGVGTTWVEAVTGSTGYAGLNQTLNANSSLNFNASTNFASPTMLLPSNATTSNPANDLSSETPSMLGIFLGQVEAPDTNVPPVKPSPPPPVPPAAPLATYNYAFMGGGNSPSPFNPTPAATISPYVTYYAQYLDPVSNHWTTYQVLPYERMVAQVQDAWNGFSDTLDGPVWYEAMSDPRCNRFGRGYYYYIPQWGTTTMRPDSGLGYSYNGQTKSAYPGWSYKTDPASDTGVNPFMGGISENKPLSGQSTFYQDPDGVTRLADGAYTPTGSITGLPLATSNYPSRPYILNRQFRSVADMGYAYRDMPWKQVDFFTTNSADSALLDIFSPYEPSAAGYHAGVVDLNTRQVPVLTAVMKGAIQTEDTGATMADSDAASIAQALVNFTSNPAKGPLSNKADLVARCATLFSYPAAPVDASIIKRQYEGAIRPLSTMGNVRTWNLLIDVIAQSGHYPPTSTTLNQFVVEGERRYWLHVAIDRYTGKIVDQYLESVYE